MLQKYKYYNWCDLKVTIYLYVWHSRIIIIFDYLSMCTLHTDLSTCTICVVCGHGTKYILGIRFIAFISLARTCTRNGRMFDIAVPDWPHKPYTSWTYHVRLNAKFLWRYHVSSSTVYNMLVVKVQFHFSKMTGATLLSRYICVNTQAWIT